MNFYHKYPKEITLKALRLRASIREKKRQAIGVKRYKQGELEAMQIILELEKRENENKDKTVKRK